MRLIESEKDDIPDLDDDVDDQETNADNQNENPVEDEGNNG